MQCLHWCMLSTELGGNAYGWICENLKIIEYPYPVSIWVIYLVCIILYRLHCLYQLISREKEKDFCCVSEVFAWLGWEAINGNHTKVIFPFLVKYRSDVLNVIRMFLLGMVSWILVKIVIRCCFLISKLLRCSFNTYHEGFPKIIQ